MAEVLPQQRWLRSTIALFSLLFLSGATSGVMSVPDFGQYWSAARVSLTGGNPYDPTQLLPYQRLIEPDRKDALPYWAPPWTIALVTPFAWPDFPAARWTWLALNATGVALSALALMTIYRGASDRHTVAILLSFTFYPLLLILGLGQVSGMTLFAVVGFLFALSRGQPFVAGLFTALLLVKLQVGGFFALAIGLWVLDQRKGKVLVGGLVGVTVLTLLAVIPNPRLFAHYGAALEAGGPREWVTPTPAMLLRSLFGGAFWLSMIPPALGLVGVTVWYALTRRRWDWPREAQGLSFIAFFCSPYAWVYDESLFLVPLVATAASCDNRRLVVLLILQALLTTVALTMNAAGQMDHAFWWFAPAVLGIWGVLGLFFRQTGHKR